MSYTESWQDSQKFELDWHTSNNNCANSYNEETKQFKYAELMGLNQYRKEKYGIVSFDFGNQSVLDVGGGPYSILLKSKASSMAVIDPLPIPQWCRMRYEQCNIDFINKQAEDEDEIRADIVLCYNVLEHTEDPEKICKNMLQMGKTIHFFDWIDTPSSPGHPHTLREETLNEWLGGEGQTIKLNENGLYGRAYYGVFKGK